MCYIVKEKKECLNLNTSTVTVKWIDEVEWDIKLLKIISMIDISKTNVKKYVVLTFF